jgi:LysR family transcriptional regulator, mexEF-oprN operon transcriptional activator
MVDSFERDLDLNLLRVFVVVAQERSVTNAAARLYVTQPAVSASLRRLTEFVGADLFIRQGQGIRLTVRGEELFAAAQVHLGPLVAATKTTTTFDASKSAATVRVGLGDGMMYLMSPLLALLREQAPHMHLVVLPVQFRNVEELLISRRVDLAVTVADDVSQSIIRHTLPSASNHFLCLYDSRFFSGLLTEAVYFEHAHVAVSYAGDTRGIVEDQTQHVRLVRVSVPSLSMVADAVDGSPLLATVPSGVALHAVSLRPHLRAVAVPFALESQPLEMLWLRAVDSDAAICFVRERLAQTMTA